MPNQCSCKTLKQSQCSFNASASKKYCGHHEPCKRPITKAVKKSTNPKKKTSSKTNTKALQLSKKILEMDAAMQDTDYYQKMEDDHKLWTKKFSSLFRLLIKLRELDQDMFADTDEKLTLPFSDIGYGQDENSEDYVLYNKLYPT